MNAYVKNIVKQIEDELCEIKADFEDSLYLPDQELNSCKFRKSCISPNTNLENSTERDDLADGVSILSLKFLIILYQCI